MSTFVKSFAFSCAIALVALTFGVSCESADSYDISVSPRQATVRPGQSVSLEASGWGDYKWSLETPGLGVLSRTTGSSVVYTANKSYTATESTDGSSQIQRIVVTAVGSDVETTGSSSNATTRVGYTATAEITHVY